jgi:subtilisin
MQFVLSHRRAGRRTAKQLASSHSRLTKLLAGPRFFDIVHEGAAGPLTGRHFAVIEADRKEIRARARQWHRDLLCEPHIAYRPHLAPILTHAISSPAGARDKAIRVTIRGGGKPLFGAQATIVYFDSSGMQKLAPVRTDAKGAAVLPYPSSIQPKYVLAEPAGEFWAMYVEDPASNLTIDCPPLPAVPDDVWWRKLCGAAGGDGPAGKDIRIGVVGTGVGPHPWLRHVRRVDGLADLINHETHVCGIIAARDPSGRQAIGLAPRSMVASTRIFKLKNGELISHSQGFIAHRIEQLASPESRGGFAADLINLSFGGVEHSSILRDGIRFALEQGALCIASAGNNFGQAVEFPAAYPECVAASAVGQLGWAPEESISGFWTPDRQQDPDLFGDHSLFLAVYSARGRKLFCAAPGNGIVSTVPARFKLKAPLAVMDGTSLAAPLACGTLARILAATPKYLALPRDHRRARMARAILRKSCLDIGLKPEFQGTGVPAAPPQ